MCFDNISGDKCDFIFGIFSQWRMCSMLVYAPFSIIAMVIQMDASLPEPLVIWAFALSSILN